MNVLPPHSRQSSLSELPRSHHPSKLDPPRSRHTSYIDRSASQPFLEDEEMGNEDIESGPGRPERGLEKTLDDIGFGAYQLRLLILAGCGWLSDNASLQCVAVIIPRVQIHYGLSSTAVGFLSASMMTGMMIGAIGWGVVSDIVGRQLPFNMTLFLTGVFGLLASYAPSFGWLCLCMGFLGTAVGGSMPTDGTLFLENLPESKQYLLTLLSVFFSLGAVLTSILGLVFLPGASCEDHKSCDFEAKSNDGWRRLLFVLGLINMAMFAGRFLLFKLHESPRYLLANNRPDEAVLVLRRIASYNDQNLTIEAADVEVPECPTPKAGIATLDVDEGKSGDGGEGSESRENSPGGARIQRIDFSKRGRVNSSSPLMGASGAAIDSRSPSAVSPQAEQGSSGSPDRKAASYASLGVLPPSEYDTRGSFPFHTPSEELDETTAFKVPPPRRLASRGPSFPRVPEALEDEEGDEEQNGNVIWGKGPLDHKSSGAWSLSATIEAWRDRIGMLFVPQWRRTTWLMWGLWGGMSLAYGMFNVWLPTVLEERAKEAGAQGLTEALTEYVIYAAAGIPGSLLGAYAIESRLGRRRSLALFTILTAAATFTFIGVRSKAGVIASGGVISLMGTGMYAVLYGMTPEVFAIEIRGTACGTSAAISRLTGILAPLLAGALLSISSSFPLFMSAALFAVVAVAGLALPFERAPGGNTGGVSAVMH